MNMGTDRVVLIIVGVDSLVFFGVPDAGKELIHVHGPKVLPTLKQSDPQPAKLTPPRHPQSLTLPFSC
ncbi:hypothetical protein V6N11_036905 [Hibiscus sabdariffa]|uniref:Uncharacterized protein n=1 Tax=Hibiscus sabdariffa TaxID=183260 RepID=A0ABR2RBW2_9ROSI